MPSRLSRMLLTLFASKRKSSRDKQETGLLASDKRSWIGRQGLPKSAKLDSSVLGRSWIATQKMTRTTLTTRARSVTSSKTSFQT